jgi:ABC-type amino acid transport substrate-binding protein
MRKIGFLILLMASAAGLGYGIAAKQATAPAKVETAGERVARTGVLRCGYGVWYPGMIIDPNTGAKSGITYDIVTEIARRLQLKVDWTEETGFGQAEQGMASGRFDAMCADVCMQSYRTKFAYFSRPFSAHVIYKVARADDTRFDEKGGAVGEGTMRVGSIDNTILDEMAAKYAPHATRVDISQLGGETDLMMALSTGKIDLAFNQGMSLARFDAANPGKVKAVGPPVDLCRTALMLPPGDDHLKYMIDQALGDMIADGTADGIVEKYIGPHPDWWKSAKDISR